MVNKYIKDGNVAVLYSPGYGAGWSTWNSDHADFLLFDKTLVDLAMIEGSNPDKYLEENGFEDVFTGGWRDIEIEWIPEGTAFEVCEYDGNESFSYSDKEWTVA